MNIQKKIKKLENLKVDNYQQLDFLKKKLHQMVGLVLLRKIRMKMMILEEQQVIVLLESFSQD